MSGNPAANSTAFGLSQILTRALLELSQLHSASGGGDGGVMAMEVRRISPPEKGVGFFIVFLVCQCSPSCGDLVPLTRHLLELLLVLFPTCCLAWAYSCFWDPILPLFRACLPSFPFNICGSCTYPPLTEWLLCLRLLHITIGYDAMTDITLLVQVTVENDE